MRNKDFIPPSKDVLAGKVCPYCGNATELTDSAEIYSGTSYGMIYICRPCNAYVGCHAGTTRAMGRLANKELREAKKKAHETFDRIWRNHYMTRYKAYSWLSVQLGIPRDYTHIGMFDVVTCKRVIELAEAFLAFGKDKQSNG